nr:hypothetical protein [Methylobacterium sp. ZNC0032]
MLSPGDLLQRGEAGARVDVVDHGIDFDCRNRIARRISHVANTPERAFCAFVRPFGMTSAIEIAVMALIFSRIFKAPSFSNSP